MYNQELFEKVCNVECSPYELEKFIAAIDKMDFDLESPFEKYYSLDKILNAIQKYQAGEINAKYLANWMSAYNWIIMGGFPIEEQGRIGLREFMMRQLVDWLDSLSYFENENGRYNLDPYKNVFGVLDLILFDLDLCEAVFAPHGENENSVVVLVKNKKAKYFVRLQGELDYMHETITMEQTTWMNLEMQAQALMSEGYSEFKYSH